MKVKVDDYRSYKLAGIGERFAALFIDNILLAIIVGFVGARGGWLAGSSVAFVIGALYHWYMLTANNGQTLGKRLMGIRVISAKGGKISDVDALLRYVGYSINGLLFGLGWLWAFFDEQRQGWHDKMARTYVVMANEAAEDIVYVDSLDHVERQNGKPKRKVDEPESEAY
jgi:uncharacterized RDD family membrane protein YckC